MKKKNTIILISIFLILLGVLGVVFVSYGFITNRVAGNEESKKATFKRNSVSIEFSDGTEKLVSNQDGYFIAGSTISKSFNIKNTGSESVAFDIMLDKIVNPFTRIQDLTYELYSDDELISSGIFPTEETYMIANNQKLTAGTSKNFKLLVKYATSDENQIADSGKTIEATLAFQETTDE